MATNGARAALSKIRQLRIALLTFSALLGLWWIVEFLTYEGRRSGVDAFDFVIVPISIIIGWLVYQAWHARCPRCGNPFFINSGLPLGFHFSTQCPYCALRLKDMDEPLH